MNFTTRRYRLPVPVSLSALNRQPLIMRHFLLGLLVLAGACHPVPGPDKSFTGAVLGAGWGAGAGAIIGHQTGNAGPGAGIGAAFGGTSGFLTGVGLDITEGTELQQQRELDALKVQVAANYRGLVLMQDLLDDRTRQINLTLSGEEVYFDPGRASLRAGSAEKLQRFAEAIKSNPFAGSIMVHGHSDDTGDSDTNLRLSEARARSVATFLINQGISFDQIKLVSHGASRPLASNSLDTGKQLNRRVEVVLLK